MGKFDPVLILRLFPKGISQAVGRAKYTMILTVLLLILLKNLEKNTPKVQQQITAHEN